MTRIGRLLLWLHGLLALGFLVLPMFVIVPLSFNAGGFFSFPMPGWSLRWYVEVWHSELWWRALHNSLAVASGATLLATTLGTLAAVGLHLARFPGRGALMGLMLAPMIVPVVIVAAGVYFFYLRLGLVNSLLGLVLAHAALGAPFVVVTVSATLAGFDRNLVRAAQSLGAGPLTVFRRILLPLTAPGIVSGALFAFVTSFDELVIALFLTGPAQRTLPRQMFDGIRENLSPSILAVATLLVALAVLLLLAAELLRRRSLRMRGMRA